MKRVIILALTIALCLTLSSCKSDKSQPNDTVQEFKNGFLSAQEITMNISLTADYGERVYDYGLKYTGNLTNGKIEVTSPEEIAGIIISLAPDGKTLIYDGAELNTGPITPDGLSPTDAIPLLLTTWSEGYVSESFREKIFETETVSSLSDISENVSVKTWFNTASSLPIFAEISYDGYTVISCKFDDIVIK